MRRTHGWDGVVTGYPEPPAVGSEIDTLVGSLERQRATFAYKCADLTSVQLRRSVGTSTMTLGGLLKHLAYMEDLNFTYLLAGRQLPAPWRDMPEGRDAIAWRTAADDEADELYALWAAAVDRSRTALVAAVRDGGAAATYEVRPGMPSTVRRLVVDFIEEYGRHTGHADLIRESIDGRIGEDPPGPPFAFTLG